MISFEKFVIQDDIDKYNMLSECGAEIEKLQQRIDKVIKIFEECKMLFPHEFSWEEQVDNALEILKGEPNNE